MTEGLKKLQSLFVTSPFLLRFWYNCFSLIDRNSQATVLNYGFKGKERLKLPPDQEHLRYGLQLYHFVASKVPLKGKKVLEIGSGRGGGASYVALNFAPKSYLAIDFCYRAIRFCQRFYGQRNLEFMVGDALRIPAANGSFDVVLSIESAELYRDIDLFFKGVFRVLKPGGTFLLADTREENQVHPITEELKDAGFRVLNVEDITRNVVAALDADSSRKLESFRESSPKLLLPVMEVFSATKGSSTYNIYKSGRRRYLVSVLQKPKYRDRLQARLAGAGERSPGRQKASSSLLPRSRQAGRAGPRSP